MPTVPKFVLNNGVHMPAIGLGSFGGWEREEQEAAKAWYLTAIDAGIRHFDSAQFYHSEKWVGAAIRESGIPREDFFVTTKLAWHHHSRVAESFQESLDRLQSGYIDLFLMHFPQRIYYDGNPAILKTLLDYPKGPDGSLRTVDSPTFAEVWAEMEKLLDTGKVRAIGVSNFSIQNLDVLLKSAKVVPAVNQIEVHPHLTETKLVEYCKQKGIVPAAYTPTGWQDVLADPVIAQLASKYRVTPVQLTLGWHVARGVAAVPKSSNAGRQKENIQLPTLEQDDVEKITALDRGQRLNCEPDKNGKIFGATREEMGW